MIGKYAKWDRDMARRKWSGQEVCRPWETAGWLEEEQEGTDSRRRRMKWGLCDFNRVTVLGYDKMKEGAGVKSKGSHWSLGERPRDWKARRPARTPPWFLEMPATGMVRGTWVKGMLSSKGPEQSIFFPSDQCPQSQLQQPRAQTAWQYGVCCSTLVATSQRYVHRLRINVAIAHSLWIMKLDSHHKCCQSFLVSKPIKMMNSCEGNHKHLIFLQNGWGSVLLCVCHISHQLGI